MKRLFSCLTVCVIAILLMSCGNQETNAPNSAGYLPARLEEIKEGGIVPKGYEAETEMNAGNYPMESFWGSWVPISEVSSQKTFTVNTATYTNEETGEESESFSIELKVFPKELNFSPPWEEVASSSAISLVDIHDTELWDMNQEKEDYKNTVLGTAFQNHGLGQGYVEYDYIEPENAIDILGLMFGGNYQIIYGISEDTLAIGLISSKDSMPDGFNIEEIDYYISFSGWKLTLSYEDESVTYIPKYFDQSKKIDLYKKGLEPGYESIDGIIGIFNYDDSTQQIMYDLHEGYKDADMDFAEDGIATITDFNGKRMQYQFLMSSRMLTLISESEIAVYSAFRNSAESPNVSAGRTIGIINAFESTGASINADGTVIGFSAMSDFQKLLDAGFTTSVDINQAMNSCIVSDEIVLYKSGVSIKVKVVNPWDSIAALRECKICYVYVDDTTGIISSADDSVIGTTEYEDMERYFEAAYEKTPNLLRYKTFSNVDYESRLERLGDVRKELLDIDNSEMELLYHFKDGILCAYEIQCPELLYNGLQDNISSDALADMDAATMTGIIDIRDDVLAQLKSAFDNAGISVDINESTGEIVMDSMVLFDTDSSILTAEGQDYIDGLMTVYASVILDDSLKDVISEVRFEGHTDSNGSYDYNLVLSQERADAVLDYCLSSGATSMNRDQKERLNSIAYTIGYSYSNLVYDSPGNENEEASRRVAIKFFIDAKAEKTEVSSNEQNTFTTGVLSADDFRLTEDGESYNAFECVDSGSAWYFYYDSSSGISRERVVETARGIHIGDSVSDLFSAYGNTDTYLFDDENPFYSADDYRSAMMDECKSYVLYWDNDENLIAFFLDDWNCVSWIIYYIA